MRMFYNCSRLQAVNVTSFNTDKVQSMQQMFTNCSSLKSLDLRSFNTPQVKDMSAMFYRCTQLITIYCANNWKSQLQVLTISDNMFSFCTELVGENGTQYDANYTDITYARPDGVNGKKGYFTTSPKEVYTVFNDGTGMLTYCYDKYRLTRIGTTELYDPSVTRFSSYSDQVTKAVIDASMKEVRLSSTENMFFGGTSSTTLKNLTVIEGLENLNTEIVTNMSFMFYGCSNLTSLDLITFNTKNVTNMSGMFNGCKGLISIELSSTFSTKKVTNMNAMFSECAKLQGLDFSSFDTENVTDMRNMFFNCKALKSLDLSMFKTTNLQRTTLMFKNCSSLTTIYCTDDWSTEATALINSDNMFSGCTKLVGEYGTVYDANHVDVTYARPDKAGQPGYFTKTKPTNVTNVFGDKVNCRKFIRNGQLIIQRGNEFFNAKGERVE